MALLLPPVSCELPPRVPPTGQFIGMAGDPTGMVLGRLLPTDDARDFLSGPLDRR